MQKGWLICEFHYLHPVGGIRRRSDNVCILSSSLCTVHSVPTAISISPSWRPSADHENREHELIVRQESRHAGISRLFFLSTRWKSTNPLITAECTPIDPAPIIQHRAFDPSTPRYRNPNQTTVTYTLSASLTKPDNDVELRYLKVDANFLFFVFYPPISCLQFPFSFSVLWFSFGLF